MFPFSEVCCHFQELKTFLAPRYQKNVGIIDSLVTVALGVFPGTSKLTLKPFLPVCVSVGYE